jgi:hypothetical protein
VDSPPKTLILLYKKSTLNALAPPTALPAKEKKLQKVDLFSYNKSKKRQQSYLFKIFIEN